MLSYIFIFIKKSFMEVPLTLSDSAKWWFVESHTATDFILFLLQLNSSDLFWLCVGSYNAPSQECFKSTLFLSTIATLLLFTAKSLWMYCRCLINRGRGGVGVKIKEEGRNLKKSVNIGKEWKKWHKCLMLINET